MLVGGTKMCMSTCCNVAFDKAAIKRISEHINGAPKNKEAETASREEDVL